MVVWALEDIAVEFTEEPEDTLVFVRFLTPDGEIQRFRPGIEKIIRRRAVPVVPAALCRLWGSWFSRRKTGGIKKIPGRLFARVPVYFGEPVPPSEVTAEKLELLVRTLRGAMR